MFRAFYIQVYNNEYQVLDNKSYSYEKQAINWANKKLN